MQISRRTILTSGVAALGVALLPRRLAAADPTELLARPVVEEVLASISVPGASVAIIQGGKNTVYCYGLTRAKSGARIDEWTRFQAASITKTITALCVLTLVRDGLLALDDPVNQHLKSWRLGGINGDQVTLRMLLNHTGGTNIDGFPGYPSTARVPALLDVLSGRPPAVTSAIESNGILGSFRYSSGGYAVLQQVIVDRTGESFPEVVARNVFTRLDMAASSFDQPPKEAGRLAWGHFAFGKEVKGGFRLYPELAPAGLWTTPADIARAIAAIMASLNGRPAALLPRALAVEMTDTRVPIDRGYGLGNFVGLGTFVDDKGWFSHPGATAGFRCRYRADPQRDIGVVVMTNSEAGDAIIGSLQDRVAKAFGW